MKSITQDNCRQDNDYQGNVQPCNRLNNPLYESIEELGDRHMVGFAAIDSRHKNLFLVGE